jgi:broad specificity phosphatase PhoE
MKKVTIVRHAESKMNAGLCKTDDELRNCGLTDWGKQQAGNLNQHFDILIVSKLRRAIETYKNSNISAEQVIFSHLPREQKEGHTLNFLEGEAIEPESPDDVRKRAREFAKFIKTLDGENIGIISHGFFISYFLGECGQQMVPTYNIQAITFDLV